MLATLWQDTRNAARSFSKRPGFTATTILTLGLGIGASSATFSVVYGVLLKSLPFEEPERIVTISHRGSTLNGTGVWNHGPATYVAAFDNHQAFEAVGGWDDTEVSVIGEGDPEQVRALAVSSTTLPLLRIRPAIGRFFDAEDDRPETPRRVVLTHGYWQRRFGGAANAIGRTLTINGVSAEIIGVAPAAFAFPRKDVAILLPLKVNRSVTGIQFGFQAIGRLKPDVDIARAEADMARWLTNLPPHFARLSLAPYIRPLSEYASGDVGRVLWILLGAAGIVLLIACGNVANLFLVRAEGRQQELAVRTALGASRGRIARVLLSESILLALAGGVVGLALTMGAIRLLRAVAPAELPRVNEIAVDPAVLLFTLSISILSGTLFGLVAVLKYARPDITALRDGGRSASTAPGRHRARNALVVAQVALALTLLIVSGLMIRTFIAMQAVDPGFTDASRAQTFRLAMPVQVVSEPSDVVRSYQAISERLAQVPGVTAVGLASAITMEGEDNGNYIEMEGDPEPQLRPLRRFRSVAPGYFEAMGIRLVAGRPVTWSEIHERRPVVLISAALARQYWRDPSEALGKRLSTGGESPRREIIGVVGDERDDGVTRAATPIVYWPMLSESYGWRRMSFVVRSNRVGSPGFLGELRQAVWSVNRNLPLAAVETLEEIRARSMAQTSFAMVMLGIAAAVALLLGLVGIYSVVAYVVAQRTKEIGIRIALGAQVGEVRAMFLRRGLALTGIGVGVGILLALIVTRTMAALLFGVPAVDPATYVVVSVTLAGVALLATYVPARRASRVDPVIALRSDI